MKIVKEKLELGKAMENNNSNMKKIDGFDTVVAVDPGYAKALSDEEKAEKHISDVMEETDKAAEGITPEDPKTGKALPKTAYTKQEKVDEGLELDESLFEDIRKVDTLPNDVYTLVYDLLFPGLNDSEKKPHLVAKEEEITVPEEKSFIDLDGADIGVQIKSEEDEVIVAYVKKIAEILGLETYEKKVPGELKYGDHILAIKIPEELSEKNATEFLANLGIDEEGIRGQYKIKESIDLTSEELRSTIARYFDYSLDFEFADLVEDILNRIDDQYSSEDVMQAIDDGLIYYSDQWKVLQHYCTPKDANWEDAFDEFTTDIYNIVDKINKEEKEKEDEETEVEVEETDESLKEGKKINEKGLTRSERHNRMMDKIFASHDKYVDKMANFLSERGVSDEEIAELKKGVGLSKDAMRDKIVELGLEDEFKKTFESLKESRFPRFELEIWVPGSGGDDERERTLIKTDDIDEVLETVYNTKLDSGEAFLFTDLRRNFQLDQEYSREQLFDDIKDNLGDEYDLSGWDEYFVEINAIYSFEESKKCEAKETISLEDVMDVKLEDDETENGGISFDGETVRDFIDDVSSDETKITTIDELNDALKQCGIKPVGVANEGKKCKSKECKEKKLDEDAMVISSLSEFKPWSGAVKVWDMIVDNDRFDEFDEYIESNYPDGIDISDLNDMLWFDGMKILDILGLLPEEREVVVADLSELYSGEFDDLTESDTIEVLKNYLEDFYKFKVTSLKFEKDGDTVNVTDIVWDLDDEYSHKR